jgi:type III restriction enzyme
MYPFRTVRPTIGTTKSHISHVVLDASKWEHSAAFQLEKMPQVMTYARNDHLDLTIPYEWLGIRHEYRPDYLIRLRSKGDHEIKIILEVKGFESEQDRQKEIGAKRWVKAINRHREFGHWAFVIRKDPQKLRENLREIAYEVSG